MSVRFSALFFGVVFTVTIPAAETFTVATFNVENYLVKKFGTRPVKPEISRVKVTEAIVSIGPDVLALQEMGRRAALMDLHKRLKARGLEYPHFEWVNGADPAIHLAVLSRFPITVHSHTNLTYLLDRRRFQVSRGFGEARIRLNRNYEFTLLNVHLKSKRPVPQASEAEMRLHEARTLRKIIESRLKVDPDANIMVVGDLNDTPNAEPIRDLIGRRAPRLVDLRPFEDNGDHLSHPINSKYLPRRVSWTSFYGTEDSFSRFDYILASKGMARELDRAGTYIHAMADWGVASDHRPVVARFVAENR
jgi:endonuclease/exonuclease/phosphatase family metal-dependent hydrolase|tara:strand:+ start:178 stop:1095 length:918 start_codon:yes stop_codon:yes gene_type:complete